MTFSQSVIDHTFKSMSFFRSDWHLEMPLKMHIHELDRGGVPRWSPEFAYWMSGPRKNNERQARIKLAMRRLRKMSVREYEVAYRMIVLGEAIEQTTAWLNDRAIRNDKPERYEVADTLVIIQSAVDKLNTYY